MGIFKNIGAEIKNIDNNDWEILQGGFIKTINEFTLKEGEIYEFSERFIKDIEKWLREYEGSPIKEISENYDYMKEIYNRITNETSGIYTFHPMNVSSPLCSAEGVTCSRCAFNGTGLCSKINCISPSGYIEDVNNPDALYMRVPQKNS